MTTFEIQQRRVRDYLIRCGCPEDIAEIAADWYFDAPSVHAAPSPEMVISAHEEDLREQVGVGNAVLVLDALADYGAPNL